MNYDYCKLFHCRIAPLKSVIHRIFSSVDQYLDFANLAVMVAILAGNAAAVRVLELIQRLAAYTYLSVVKA